MLKGVAFSALMSLTPGLRGAGEGKEERAHPPLTLERMTPPLRVLAGAAILALAACTGPAPAPSPSVTQDQAAPDPAPTAPEPTSGPIVATGIGGWLQDGNVPLDVPADWSGPEGSGYPGEGYVLQDLTWWLDGQPGAEGASVTAMAVTPGQGEVLSDGYDFEGHVRGMAEVLGANAADAPIPARTEVGGFPAARLVVSLPDGGIIVVWLYDLGEAWYELSIYVPPAVPDADAVVAELDQVAGTFAVPAGAGDGAAA